MHQKYQTEFAFNSFVKFPYMIRPSDIYSEKGLGAEDEKKMAACQIYFVCKRPKPILHANSVSYNDEQVCLRFELALNGNRKNCEYIYPRKEGQFPKEAIHFQLTGPQFQYFTMSNKEGQEMKAPVSIMIQAGSMSFNLPEIYNVEVLYIGQAFGGDRDCPILERLRNHSTLQKILAQENTDSPDDEILLFLFEYYPARFMIKIAPGEQAKISGEEDNKHRDLVLEAGAAPARQVAITEAALIRYFQPKYNKLYKESFPSTNLEILKECYALDLVSVAIEVQAEELGTMFYTPTVKSTSHHIANFELHDAQSRKSFFSV